RAGSLRDQPCAKTARQGTRRAGAGAVAALARRRAARRQAAAIIRSARVRLDRAGCRRRDVLVPRRLLSARAGPERRGGMASVARQPERRAYPGRSNYRKEPPRTDRHRKIAFRSRHNAVFQSRPRLRVNPMRTWWFPGVEQIGQRIQAYVAL